MSYYASGKHAWRLCDMCGFRYKYHDLKPSSYGTLHCSTCHDGGYDLSNHPQNKAPPRSRDPQGLKDPRPDTKMETPATEWNPRQTIWTFDA